MARTHRRMGAGAVPAMALALALGASGIAARAAGGDAPAANLVRLPLAFEPNRGQSPGPVLFQGRSQEGALFLTRDAAVLSFSPVRDSRAGAPGAQRAEGIRLEWAGARGPESVEGEGPLRGTVSYFRGRDPSRWRTGLPTYSRVLYRGLYPGVDVAFYGNPRHLEADFLVAAGADPGRARLRVKDLAGRTLAPAVDTEGNLRVRLRDGEFVLKAPRAFQGSGEERRAVFSRFVTHGRGVFGIEVGPYDRSLPLIIDPVLNYSTYFGGSLADGGTAIATDASGNVYVAGETSSYDFPVTGGQAYGGNSDAFLLKLDPTGQTVLYCAYLGGTQNDFAYGLAVYPPDFPVVTGTTSSPDFPTVSAFQSSPGGGSDAFIAEFNDTGTALVFSTYLGGTGLDSGRAVSCTTGGIAFEGVKGSGTTFVGFPVTAFGQGGGDDILAAYFSPTGALWDLFTLGGAGQERAGGCYAYLPGGSEPMPRILLTGQTRSADFPISVGAAAPFQTSLWGTSDAFVSEIDLAFSGLSLSTYLGGEYDDAGTGIAPAPGGIVVVGTTTSYNFPRSVGAFQTMKAGLQDAFVAELSLDGTALVYGSYLGGASNDAATGVAVDGQGRAFVSGYTSSTAFPTVDPIQLACANCTSNADGFLSVVNALGNGLDFSTWLGGSGWDEADAVALDPGGEPWLTGLTYSTDFPTASPIQPTLAGSGPLAEDAFVSKISLSSQPCSFSCTANASPTAGPAPLTVNFTSAITGSQGCTGVPTYAWDFGDGVGTSALQNPTYTYASAGSYAWSLTIAYGTATCNPSGVITVCDLQCQAWANQALGYAPATVQFTGSGSFTSPSCTGSIAYLWDFGDGTTSTEQSPSHVYSQDGYYGWSLTVASGSATCSQYGTLHLLAANPGQPFAWGNNGHGQVGDGTGAERHQPVAVSNLTGVVALSAGGDHSLAVRGDGTVWAWGRNDSGQLGDGTGMDRLAPVMVTTIGSVVKTSAGGDHSLALRSDQTVWSWGANDSGQVGDGTTVQRSLPVHLTGLPAADEISAGLQHSLAVCNYGVYAWGSNAHGQLGDGTTTDQWTPEPVGVSGAFAISAGGYHSLALAYPILGGIQSRSRESLLPNRLFAWGANDRGQLGQGDTAPRSTPTFVPGAFGAEAVAAGLNYSLALMPDGTVLAWGANDRGQLGDGTTTDRWSPVPVPNLAGVVAIAAGGGQSLALKSDGTLWAWGANTDGQVGNGDTGDHTSPVQVAGLTGVAAAAAGGSHSLAVATCSLACDAQAPDEVQTGAAVAFAGSYSPSPACTGIPTFHWDFGDGASSAEQNPSHAYAQDGSYTWTFTVTLGGATCAQTGTIHACSLACSVLTTIQESPWPPAPVTFEATATVTGPCTCPVSVQWDFGDGSSGASGTAVTHTYDQSGTYAWTMTAVDSCGLACTRTGTVTICGLACSASASPRSGYAPLPVAFSGSAAPAPGCQGTPTYLWDFGDGATSTDQNPTHTYASFGTYTWQMTATAHGVTCTQTGDVTVDACYVTCSASVAPDTGITGQTDFLFTAQGASPTCQGAFTYDWDFGDGTDHGTAASATHRYSAAGAYEWRLEAALGGVTCTRTGTVYVSDLASGSVQGFVGICGEQFWPLVGEGVQNLQVYAVDSAGGRHDAGLAGAAFTFSTLPPDSYTVYAELDYADTITVDNRDLPGLGCAPPGTLMKHVRSRGTLVQVGGGSQSFANVCFPPPLVFLHGALECYTRWYSSDPADGTHWDNYARSQGYFSFTPNYGWCCGESGWGLRADEVASQVALDLQGLVGSFPERAETGPTAPPPWWLVGYDMGGLVARVLTSGPHRYDEAVQALQGVFLLGTPNSGSDVLMGGGPENPMGTQAIARRFNPLYPDFGAKTDGVYVLAGNYDWWDQQNSDGGVDLYSAFTISQLDCSAADPAHPVCVPYASLAFASDPAEEHIFPYSHDQLGGPDTTADLLAGVILPAVQEGSPLVGRRHTALKPPESPVGQTMWGTTTKSTGSSHHNVPPGGVARAETEQDLFWVSRTDGMGMVALVSQGSGTFVISDTNGREVFRQDHVTGRLLYTQLTPPAGAWSLQVTADASGITYDAAFFEDTTFGALGYLEQDHYNPGDTATLRADLTGDLANVSVTSVRAVVQNPGPAGGTYAAVDLAPIPGWGGSAYAGTLPAPAAPGSYPVIFSVGGTYLSGEFQRVSFDYLNVIPPQHLFTGAFSDAPVDQGGDGLYDALRFTATADLPAAGSYGASADLYDGSGAFVTHAGLTMAVAAAGMEDFALLFDLSGAHCVQFGAPFSVRNLRLADGATLLPVDAWPVPVATAAYGGGAFQCLSGIPQPEILAVGPDEVVQGSANAVSVGGSGFQPGAVLSSDTGVTLTNPTYWSSGRLTVTATVSPAAAAGPHPLTVTNPDASTASLATALTVRVDHPPVVALQSPAPGTVLGTVPVLVSAAASDDVRVTRVDFLLDGTVTTTVPDFPFQWTLNAASVATGAHSLTARAYDTAGQHTDASVTVYKNPPTVSSVTGGGSPWKLKVQGSNFRPGMTAFIPAGGAQWTNVKVKNAAVFLIKGGKTLKSRFPVGQAVPIKLVNTDGTYVTTSYTRPR